MCDPGYFGQTCELKDYAHYVFDHLRFTWYPYVLLPIVGIAWFLVSARHQIPNGDDYESYCECFFMFWDNVADLDMAQNEYILVHQFFWPTYVVNIFSTLLGFAFCYKQWAILLISTGV